MKLFFCQCRYDNKRMIKHIADLDKESALNRFIKEMSNNNKYVGSFKIKEIKYVDNCKVELVSKEAKTK